MPMYYPDLVSVQHCVNAMRHNKGDKQFKGIYPKTEAEVPQARRELAQYFREIWNDEIQALEVELAVSEENYDELISRAIREQIILGMFQ